MKKIQSTCNYCSLACNLDFHVENDNIHEVIPTKKYPVNKGFSCIKGLSLKKQKKSDNFPKNPIIKTDTGEKKEVPWNEAYNIFSENMKKITSQYGKDSVACISTGQMTLEEMALLGHVFRNYIGGNLDGNTRLCMATSVVAYKQSFGFDAPPYTLDDLEHSDVLVFIGANPIVAHPIAWDRVRKNKNKTVITIDPRKSETAKESDYWYNLKPKSDIFLFYSLANLLIQKGWIDNDYIKKYTNDFSGFSEHVKKYNINDVYEKTGITIEELEKLATLIHQGKNVSFWWTMGVNQGYQAVRTAQSIINLAVITGNMGRPGTGANSLTGQCNAMGSRLFSNSTGLYGAGDYSDQLKREKVADVLGVPSDIFPLKPTLPYNVIIEKIISGEIKALWVLCTNPRHSWINNKEFSKALDKLDFFVVQDLYHNTDTSQNADLFLPVASGLQKEGTIINTERRISKINYVLSKSDNEKNDFEVIYNIGKALGMEDLLNGWETPESVFNMMAKVTKDSPCDFSGVTYKLLEEGYGVQWPFKEGEELKNNERRLFEDNLYYTDNKRVNLKYEDITENPMETTKQYPYILNTGRGTVGQWHTQTRTKEISIVHNATIDTAYIYIPSKLAKQLNLLSGDKVKVESINGNSSIFNVIPTEDLTENILFAPLHYIETNNLTISVYDPYSKEPSYKYAPVNIKKIN